MSSARGWHELAQEEYQLALALDPDNVGIQVDDAQNRLYMRSLTEVGEDVLELTALEPMNHQVRNLGKQWDIYNSPKFSTGGVYRDSSGGTFGSYSYRLDAEIESAPISNNWRVFAGWVEDFASFEEGDETMKRHALGGRFDNEVWQYEVYVEKIDASIDETTVAGQLGWTPGDHWRHSLAYEDFSRDTPLRAVLHDVDANAKKYEGGYRWHESLDLRWGFKQLDFSDGNLREEYISGLTWKPYAKHRWSVETDLAVYYSTNTEENVDYFNPLKSYSLPLTITPKHMTYRNYSTSWVNALRLEIGPSYQQDYGSNTNWSAEYNHTWSWGLRWSLEYGVGYASRVYDGDRETETSGFIRFNGSL